MADIQIAEIINLNFIHYLLKFEPHKVTCYILDNRSRKQRNQLVLQGLIVNNAAFVFAAFNRRKLFPNTGISNCNLQSSRQEVAN